MAFKIKWSPEESLKDITAAIKDDIFDSKDIVTTPVHNGYEIYFTSCRREHGYTVFLERDPIRGCVVDVRDDGRYSSRCDLSRVENKIREGFFRR